MPTQADQLELINKAAESQQAIDEARKEVNARYYTEAQRLAMEHQDNIDKVTLAYAGTPQLKEMIDKENALYAAQIAKLESDKRKSTTSTLLLKLIESSRLNKTLIDKKS